MSGEPILLAILLPLLFAITPRTGPLLVLIPVAVVTGGAAAMLFTPRVTGQPQRRRYALDVLIVGSLILAVMDLAMALNVEL